jgi:hypothetical protein
VTATSDGYEVAGFDDVQEMFHRNGWTDGLPVVPPTPERVDALLAAAGLAADDQLGYYEERRIPVLAGKVAVNAVMAGCLPAYFPVVVALVESMLDPGFMLHVANSSTGSFTVAFVVNGPVRQALDLNYQGNVLGPGNRANAAIGRTIRLVQLNVMGSVPGAGVEEPAHGRAVLDRSMMGQPAKYVGFHIVENEEAVPGLLPTHVELGHRHDDSTVTVYLVAGYTWLDAHAQQTPDAWVDTVAHYVVGVGRLRDTGYGLLLVPPESARLLADAGWTKQDVRQALYERTRRSVAWVKANGDQIRMQRERHEPVLPGDEERFMAIAGSPSPQDLPVVVSGGPAGAWPYYLWSVGEGTAVTRIIKPAPGKDSR